MINTSAECLMILTTVDGTESATELAQSLVKARVAACVQVDGPLTSHYRWDGKLESSIEYRLVIKTTASKEAAVYDMIKELHNYDLPQIVSVPFSGGLDEYVNWVEGETT